MAIGSTESLTAMNEKPKSRIKSAPQRTCQPNMGPDQPLYTRWAVRAKTCAVLMKDQSSMKPICATGHEIQKQAVKRVAQARPFRMARKRRVILPFPV